MVLCRGCSTIVMLRLASRKLASWEVPLLASFAIGCSEMGVDLLAEGLEILF